MKGVGRVGESGGNVTARVGFVEMRVEHNLSAASRRPAEGFRIAPAFMADRNTKRQRTDLKNPPAGTERIGAFLGRVQLYLVLKTSDGSIRIDDQRTGQQAVIGDAFRSEDHREIRFPGSLGDYGPGAFQESRVGRRNRFAYPVAWNVALGKADDAGAFDGGLGDGLFG